MKRKHNRVTVVDIARQAGVSTQTVSRVVNNNERVAENTRARVKDIIRRLNYRPNRAARILASQRSLTIGLIIPNVANPYYPEIVHGVEAYAAEEGYSVLLYNTERKAEREKKALELLEEYQVAGVLMCAAVLPDDELIYLLGHQQAAVMINRILPDELAGRVIVDYKTGMVEAVNHMIATGRKNIAYLSYELSHYYSNPTRKAGFEQALKESGRDVSTQIIIPTELGFVGGYNSTIEVLLNHSNVDGIVCYNDIVAIGALKACADRNKRVPEDIAIIGCDDILMSRYVTPALTSISISQYDLGVKAGEMLVNRIRKESCCPETIFTPKLIIRASTERERQIS